MHRCAAKGCDKKVGSKLLMCWHHWRLVPRILQRKINHWYRRRPDGQPVYGEAVREAVAAVKYEEEIARCK